MKLKFNVSILLLLIFVIITNCLAETTTVESKEPSPTINAREKQPTQDSNKDTTNDIMGLLGINADDIKKESEPTSVETNSENFEVVTDCDNLKIVMDSYPELSRQMNIDFQLHTMNCCNDEEFICKDINGGRYITEL